jgi:ABC-type multidrug transport system fused ATPase/permease subunit
MKTLNTLKKFNDFLAPHERVQAMLLFGMTLVMALLDVIGVASIMPFMAVIANPLLVESNLVLSRIFLGLGFTNVQQFLIFLGFMVFLFLVLSLGFKAITTYAQLRFTLMCEYSLGQRLIEGYLHQPYSWFLNRHSADLGKTILSEVSTVIGSGLMPLMSLIAQSVASLAVLGLLILVDPLLALTVGSVLGLAYALIIKLMSGFLSRIGSERIKANQDRFTIVSEAFGAAKEVKVGGLEQAYVRRFAAPAETYAKHKASALVVAQVPRFVLEAITFGGMLLLVLSVMVRSGSLFTALPVISLYAFAGYRLMPALQQIYSSVSQLLFVGPALDALHLDLMALKPVERTDPSIRVMPFKHYIQLSNIEYTYPNAAQPVLNKINLTIPANSTIGLVGSTGSGKTTTVDLILGLLEAQEGTLTVDGKIINSSNHRQWQKALGYVPQQIYLADDTIAANIAFGVDSNNIDQASVERAARIANLHKFVINDLPQGYATTVGERGVRLSGGQRQRIGIARALYHNPQVLILDEATSALDNLTEQAVMEAVSNLGQNITIILIAHRLSTVRQCQQIYLLEKGRVKAQGTYAELTQGSDTFRSMAGVPQNG